MSTTIRLSGSRLRVQSAYNPLFVERFRTIEGRKFDGESKDWTFPASAEALTAICDVCGILPWMLDGEIQKILANEGIKPKHVNPVDLYVINGHHFHTVPFDHQRVNLARLIENDRWLIADEMGTGKTHAICNRLAHEPGEPNVLILCPKSVVSGWCQELMKHANLFGEIVQGSAKQRAEALEPGGNPIKIANYELLLHSDFSDIQWDIIVLDELHRVKNFTTQTSKAVRKLTVTAKQVWGLSGTPAPNGLQDWFGVLAAVDPNLLPTKTKTAFEARYCVKREIQPGVWKVAGYKNVQELHGFIQSITSRVTKEEVLDLPPKTFLPRRVNIEGEQARVYRELKKDAVARIKTLKASGELTVRNILTEGIRLLQVVGGFMPTDEGGSIEFEQKCKLAALSDVIDELGERQCVIWCAFRDEVAMLVKWLESQGYTAAVLTGELSGAKRAQSIDDFRERRCQFFVGTAAAGGTGINGLTGADTCVYYSRNFSLTEYLQSQDRCHRIGTTSPVTIVKLIASGTIDDKIDQALDQKRDVQEMMLRSPEDLF